MSPHPPLGKASFILVSMSNPRATLTATNELRRQSTMRTSTRPISQAAAIQCKHKCADKSTCKHACCRRSAAAYLSRHGPNGSVAASDHLHQYRAVEAFLGTQELLEMVLKYLPLQDLLRSKRVSKHWSSTVAGDSMAKARFVVAETRKIVLPRDSPLYPVMEENEVNFVVRLINDLLFVRYPNNNVYLGLPWNGRLGFKYDPLLTPVDDPRLDMLITQPPCTTVMIILYYYQFFKPQRWGSHAPQAHAEHSEPISRTVAVPSGVTYGDIVASIKEETQRLRETSAWGGPERTMGLGWELNCAHSVISMRNTIPMPVSTFYTDRTNQEEDRP